MWQTAHTLTDVISHNGKHNGFYFNIFFIIITLSMGNTGRTQYCNYASWQSSSKPRSGTGTQPIPAFLQDTPARKHGKVLLRMASRQNGSEIKLHIQENSRPQDLTVYTDGPVRVGLHCQARWEYHPCTLMAQSGQGFTVN